MKSILISGANGFLGSHLFNFFSKKNQFKTFGLIRSSSEISRIKSNKLKNLILIDKIDFEKIFKTKATHVPSGQHALNKEYYKKIEAMQFTIAHDDGQKLNTAVNADIIILGVSRTSKTPTSIYLGERGYKVSNIPLVLHQELPDEIFNSKALKVGLTIETERL